MTLNALGKKAGSTLAIISLCAALTGAGYNYRGLVQAKDDIEKLKQTQPITKKDLEDCINKLEKRLDRIETILMQRGRK